MAKTQLDTDLLNLTGNHSLGVTPFSWLNYRAFDIGPAGALVAWTAGTKNIGLYSNVNYDGAWKYKQTGAAARIDLDDGVFKVNVATNGTAGAAVSSWAQAITVQNNGRLEAAYGAKITGPATLSGVELGTLSVESSVWRNYIGDGTGYSWTLTKRASGANTDLVTVTDSGNMSLAYGGGNRIAISTDQSIASTKTDLSSYTPLYLDGSKVSIRTGTGSVSEKAQVDANGNFGLATTPASTWGAGFPMIQMQKTMLYGDTNSAYLQTNAINTSTGLKYNAAQKALRYYQDSSNGIHSFSVAATGTAGGALTFTEVVQIDSSGNFRAGDQSVSNHIFRKDVSGTAFSVWNGAGTTPEGMNIYLGGLSNVATGKFLRCNDNTGDRLYILSNGNVQNLNNSYGAISDIKLKENIVDATPKLDKLMQVRIVNYNLKTDPDHKQLGVIAQEVEQVFPGIVEETPDYEEVTKAREVEVPAVLDDEGNEVEPATTKTEEYAERVVTGEVTKSVKYSVFVPMLIKAMQEQQEIIRKLTHRIEQLEK